MSETGFRIFNRVFSIGAALLYAGLLTAFFARLSPGEKGREICSSSSPSISFLNWPAIGRRFPREPSG